VINCDLHRSNILLTFSGQHEFKFSNGKLCKIGDLFTVLFKRQLHGFAVNRVSSVSIVTGLLDGPEQTLFLLHRAHACSRAHPASHSSGMFIP
jgi:hypothetical protein